VSLFPSAPKVVARIPAPLVVGRSAVVELDVTAEEPTKVDHIAVRLRGRQGWSVGSGKHQVSFRVTVPDLEARVMQAGTLPAGTSTFSATFELPRTMAPSHHLRPAYAELELKVQVSIPWWPDGRSRFTIPVRMPPPMGSVVRTPIAARSTRQDAPPDKPRLELSLASTRLVAGETVVGSCAVFHLDDDKPREVRLSIVPTLALIGRGNGRSRDAAAAQEMVVTIPAGAAGTSQAFQFELPAGITPTFETVSHELTWALVARTGSWLGHRLALAVPLEIVDASAAPTAASLTVAPRLADQRVAAVFATFAARAGWRSVDEAPDDRPGADAVVIVREHAGSELRLGYSYRGEAGTFLVGQVASPPLGLGLVVTPSSALRHVFFHDVEAGVPAWDRAHLVRARAGEQAIPLLRAVIPALTATTARPALGEMTRWDDDAILFERAVSSVEEADLTAMDGALDWIATAIDGGLDAVPPPPGLAVDLDAWRELARWLGGRLAIGDLSIEGRLDDREVELGLVFDATGAATALRARVTANAATSAGARKVALALPRPAADALGHPAAEPLLPLLVVWPEDLVDLQVADGGAAATWRLPDGAAAVDARRARELVEALAAALAALDPGAGPYR